MINRMREFDLQKSEVLKEVKELVNKNISLYIRICKMENIVKDL